jgi:hypothetical protein
MTSAHIKQLFAQINAGVFSGGYTYFPGAASAQ